MGFADDDLTRQLMSSCKICPAIHEPHANKYGYEVVVRVLNAIACNTMVISDYCESWELDYFKNDELIMCKTPEEYHEAIDYYLNNEDARLNKVKQAHETTMTEHTYDNRVVDLLSMIGE